MPVVLSTAEVTPGASCAGRVAWTQILGLVASLTAPKNHAANLAMWGAARAQRLDAQFLLCGEGRMRGELEGTPARLGNTETFRFLGNQRPVHPWVQAMDSFVLWSTWEGQELAIFACGLPVLASRIEGNVAVLGADQACSTSANRRTTSRKCSPSAATPRSAARFPGSKKPARRPCRRCAATLAELYQRVIERRELDTVHLLGGDSHRSTARTA